MKSLKVAYLLWLISIFGWFGLHRFYLGKSGTGMLWIITGGLLGFGSLYDLLSLPEQVSRANKLVILNKLAFEPIPENQMLREVAAVNEGISMPNTSLHDSYQQNYNSEFRAQPLCPHCWMVLPRQPQRKLKCPSCRKEIYVRTKQTLYASALLSKEDALVVDNLEFLEKFGVRESDFIREEIELSKRMAEEVRSSDVIWSLFEQKLSKSKDPELSKSLETQMVVFLNQEAREPFSILQRAAKLKLLKLKERGVRRVWIDNAKCDKCLECLRLAGKVYSIEEALKELPIPVKKCSRKLSEKSQSSYCRCDYQAKL